jgi:hypothetical protein
MIEKFLIFRSNYCFFYITSHFIIGNIISLQFSVFKKSANLSKRNGRIEKSSPNNKNYVQNKNEIICLIFFHIILKKKVKNKEILRVIAILSYK